MQTLKTIKFITPSLPSWVTGVVSTVHGPVQKISTTWTSKDYWGMARSRISAFRMNYSVQPGLYAVGSPDPSSDVLVTANYKLTFDVLRRSLEGMNTWVLVLDTKSINVWCAAGKGTFGTDEVVKRVSESRLADVVSHRRIIVPQLGAAGVGAAEVQRKTGFRVSFGPVQARDIPAYIGAGYKKTRAMSTISFSMLDRLILTPMELNPAMKKFPWIAAGILLFFGMQPSGILYKSAWINGLPFLLLGLASIFAGALLTPAILPAIPFRSFAIKGWITGIIVVFAATHFPETAIQRSYTLLIAAYLLFPALSSYLALQFTGATTFTGMSGVKKELKIGIPLYMAAAGISAVLLVIFKLSEWGIL